MTSPLKNFRLKIGLTQIQFAEVLKIHQSDLSRFENDQSPIPDRILIIIRDRYGVPVSFFARDRTRIERSELAGVVRRWSPEKYKAVAEHLSALIMRHEINTDKNGCQIDFDRLKRNVSKG